MLALRPIGLCTESRRAHTRHGKVQLQEASVCGSHRLPLRCPRSAVSVRAGPRRSLVHLLVRGKRSPALSGARVEPNLHFHAHAAAREPDIHLYTFAYAYVWTFHNRRRNQKPDIEPRQESHSSTFFNNFILKESLTIEAHIRYRDANDSGSHQTLY